MKLRYDERKVYTLKQELNIGHTKELWVAEECEKTSICKGYMTFRKTMVYNIWVIFARDEKLKHVDKFKYLERIIDKDIQTDSTVKTGIKLARTFSGNSEYEFFYIVLVQHGLSNNTDLSTWTDQVRNEVLGRLNKTTMELKIP